MLQLAYNNIKEGLVNTYNTGAIEFEETSEFQINIELNECKLKDNKTMQKSNTI